MTNTEKEVTYEIKNTYSTLNELTSQTKTVWFVCHGLGFLSRYFIKHFKDLNPIENYIIAPQAQAKHYLSGKYTHAGASWLTKENTQLEIENVIGYLDRVYQVENIPKDVKLVIFGFSQGVSIVTRWIARNQIKCDALFLYAGKTPKEFTYLSFKEIPIVKFIYGTKDEYITDKIIADEKLYCDKIFGNKIEYISFEGTHELNKTVINKLM